MAYLLLCRDRADAGDLRTKTRETHLAFIRDAGEKVLLAGPMLNPEGAPIGSLLIIDADDEAAARRFAEADPYAQAGLFETVEIQPYRIVTGALAPHTDD